MLTGLRQRARAWRRRNTERCDLRQAVHFAVESLERRLMLSAVSWTGGGGDLSWTDPNNWSTDALPGAGDNVTINATGSPTIVLSSGSQSINSLTTSDPLTVNGGILAVATTLQLSANLSLAGGTLQGGTITNTGSAEVVVQAGTLSGVTADATLDLSQANESSLTVLNGLVLNSSMLIGNTGGTTSGTVNFGEISTAAGSLTTTGTGTVVFGGNSGNIIYNMSEMSGTAGALTVGSGITIDGKNGGIAVGSSSVNGSIINEGTIEANTSGGTITVGANPSFGEPANAVSNTGAMDASGGGTLTLEGIWSNAGTIDATGSTVNLGGSFTQPGMGTFDPTGSTVNLTGTLTGNLALTATTGSWNLVQGTIFDGTYSAAAGVSLIVWSGTLNDVTADGTLDLSQVNGATLDVLNGLVLNSSLLVGNASGTTYGEVYFGPFNSAAGSLTGTGTVVFGGSGGNTILNDAEMAGSAGTLTIGSGITIDGKSGEIATFFANGSIINEGTIDSNSSGGTIAVEKGSAVANANAFTNSGTLEANGGTLTIGFPLIESPGSTLFESASSQINFGGSLTASNTGAASFQPLGSVTLNGAGTSTSPQQLVVMSQDLGDVASGFTDNFAYGSITLAAGDYVSLEGTGALYVNSLIVASGATLNLNGLHVYTRDSQVIGTITGGTLSQIPVGGQLPLATPIPADMSSAGELDQWSFFDRGGDTVTVVVNPGSGGSPAALSPQLEWANVQLLDASDNVLALGASATAGGIVTLTTVLPADGTYSIKVNAPAGHTSSTGNYNLAVYDVTPNVQALSVNEEETGGIGTAYGVDQWTFSAAAEQQVQFNLLGTSPGLVFSLTGPDGYSAFTNATTGSGLIDLPSAGQYTLAVDNTNTNGAIGDYAFNVTQTSQTSVALATPYSGSFSGSGEAQIFAIPFTTGQTLSIVLNDPSAADHTELFARFGALPTQAQFDYESTGAGPNQSILIPYSASGTWYVLVYAESIATPPSEFTLTATSEGVVLASATPGTGASNVSTTLTLNGAGFNAETAVSLVSSGGTDYGATSSSVDLPTQMTATFAAGSVPAGTYSVEVKQAGGASASLPGAFTMAASGQATFSAYLELPDPMTRHIAETLYIDYTNTGTVAIAAPLLILSATNPDGQQGALFTLNPALRGVGLVSSTTPPGFFQTIEILGSGATPGVLQPGESERVPVYYAGWLTSQWDFTQSTLNFTLQVIQANDTTAVNWASMQTALQPPGVSTAAWNVMYAGFLPQLGNTSGGFVQLLDNDATYLGNLGENVTDPAQLWEFSLDQAMNIRPLPDLDNVTDDSLPVPGSLSLSFSRAFDETIPGRFLSGLLGLGWTTPWQQSLQVESSGIVIYNDGEGMTYDYTPDANSTGAYFSEPGVTSTLSAASGGGYLLTASDGTITAFNSNGALDYLQDTDGNRITAAYTSGQLTSLTASSGQSLTLAYNSAGLISSVTDSSGRVTTYTYDSTDQHLMSVTSYNGQVTSYTYDTSNDTAQNALTSITFPDGTHQYYTYDSDGRLASSYVDGGEQKQTYTYSVGEVTTTDALGNASSQYFNEYGLLSKSIDALGNPTYYSYDANFNLISVTNALNQEVSYSYNSAGEVTSYTNILGGTSSFAYGGPFNQISSFTDPDGNTSNYSYDSTGDLLSTTYANGTSEAFTYDPEGDASSFLNPDGQATQYSYDSAGQLTSETFSNGSSYSYTYDGHGNLLTATDATGTTTFTYDPATEYLTEVAYPNGTSLTFSYDSGGRRIKMVDQTGFTTNYSYNAQGQLAGLTDSKGNPIVTYTYDADGRLSQTTNGNGTYATYQYDANSNVIQLINYAPGGTVNSSFAYTYNALGLETGETTSGGSWVYGYDGAGELTSAVFTSNNPATVPNQNLTYNYDADGNRTSTVINGVTTAYVVNDMNEYTSVGGVAYTYDANGNLLSDGTNSYTYNPLNELTGITNASGATTYTYNALGQQVASTTGGNTTKYLIDPVGYGNVVGTYTGSGSLIADYTYGLGLVSQVTPTESYYYDFDALGSTAGVSGSGGTYVNSYSYLPFGGILSTAQGIANPFQFVGKNGVLTETGGTMLMRARTYIPATGQFSSPDPLGLSGGDLNTRRYVANDPVDRSDPTGLDDSVGQQVCETLVKVAEYLVTPDEAIPEFLYTYILEKISGTPFPDPLAEALCPDPPPPQPPLPPGPSGDNSSTSTVNAEDPNAMYGPAGYGASNFVQDNGTFSYLTDFENSPTATAPAQEVTITDQLGPNLNWSTFQLTGIGWGSFFLTIPADSQSFQTIVPMTYDGETFDVDVTAGIHTSTGQVYATFQSVDPTTGLPPSNPLIGFLPPEDGTGRGEGYLSYSVSPKTSLSTGTQISNVADVSFDQGLTIATDQVDDDDPTQGISTAKEATVTIDSGAPTSTVAPLPADETSASFPVTWSGQDDTGGSGVASYTIYESEDGGAYSPWLSNTTLTTSSFTGQIGHAYSFYSVATDNVGNVQPTPTAAQATTMVVASSPPAITSSAAATFTVGAANSFTVTASGYPAPAFSETGTLPGGLSFNTATGVLSGTPAAGTVGSYPLTLGASNGVGTPASQAFTLMVAKAATTATLTKNTTAPIAYGQAVTFTATVAATSTNTISPTGTVTFMDGTATLGTGALSGGLAKFTTTTLAAGSHPAITAVYGGDANFTTSTSGSLTQTVDPAATTTTLTMGTTAAITLGQSVTFTATVAAVSPGAGTPTGTVTFLDGTIDLGTATLSGGVATLTTTAIPTGISSIDAVYSGSADFTTSTSASIPVTVNNSASLIDVDFTAASSVQSGAAILGQTGDVWNNIQNPYFVLNSPISQSDLPLDYANDSASAVELSYTAQLATHIVDGSPSFGDTPYANLMDAYLIADPTESYLNEPGPAGTVTLSGLNAGLKYSLYLYSGADTDGRTTSFTINGVTESATFGTASTFVAGENYVEFSNLAPNSSGVIQMSFNAATGEEADLNGFQLQVAEAGSTTTLTKNTTAPVKYGQNVTLTAVVAPVSPATGTPTGTVTFTDGSTSLGRFVSVGTATLADGVATLTTAALPVGSNSITAVYSGDSNFTTSTSNALSQTVDQAATTTALTKNTTAPITFGQSVTFTAAVTVVSPGAGAPTGTVSFMDGSTVLGTGTLSGGVATLTIATIPAGSNSIKAVYGGNADFSASTSGSLSQTVHQAATTTSLTKNTTAPITYGQSVTFTAAVAVVSPGAGTPTGTVSFMDGTTLLGTATLSGGVATLTTTTIPAGSNTVDAIYAGNANYTSSTSGSLSQTVHQAATTTTLTKNTTAPIKFGQSVTFTATMAVISPGAGTPTGTVTFDDGATALGTATLSGGVATFITASLPLGSNSIKALYGGSSDFTASTSGSLSQTVGQAATTTALTSNLTPTVFGQSVKFTATLAAVSPGAGTPTGSVTFEDGTTVLGTATLSGGVATFTTTSLPVSSDSIKAVYSGDTNFTTSTSNVFTQTVDQSSTTTKLTKNTTAPITQGQSVTFTATLAAVSPGAGTPTGTVTFMDNGSSIGTVTLSAGVATLITTTLPIGSNSITAVYEASTDYGTSTSNALSQTVDA